MIRLVSGLLIAAANVLPVIAQDCRTDLKADYKTPIAAEGWTFRLVANGFTRPRSILFDSKGALLVVDSRVGIKHVKFKDDGGTCLSVAQQRTLIESPDLNHGIALSPDGKTLYASTSAAVFSWPYDADTVTIGEANRTLIVNMTNADHVTRTLLSSTKQPGTLLVSRGSASNIDEDAAVRSTGHSQLRAFNVESLAEDSRPFDFATDGTLLGWGLRNSVGIAEEPVKGGIWTVENSADQLQRNGVDIHRDNPAEELNFHGSLNGSMENQGGNYGYPNCFAIWTTDGFPNGGNMATGEQFAVTQSRTLNDTTCAKGNVPPRLAFQAHMAPLDLKFTLNGSEAFLTFHGSWNRDKPVGYKVSSIQFSDGEPTEPVDSRTAARDVLSNADLSDCPEKCFRPVGLAWDAKQRLFMTSDSTGEIYVLQRNVPSVPESSVPGSMPTSSTTPQSNAAAAAGSCNAGFLGSLAVSVAIILGSTGSLLIWFA